MDKRKGRNARTNWNFTRKPWTGFSNKKNETFSFFKKISKIKKKVSVDLQLAEAKFDDLQQQYEGLKSQVAAEELANQVPERLIEGKMEGPVQFTQEEIETIVEQNEQLKEALIKLRDLSLTERYEKDKKIKELEQKLKTVAVLNG